MKMVVFLLLALLAGPIWSNMDNLDEDEKMEILLAITQCRSSCLDQFSHLIRNEENCMKYSSCALCWEMCKMVMENFETWGPICLVPDVCPPGCKQACDFVETESNESISTPSRIMVRNLFELSTDLISLEWVLDDDLESESVVLYSVLLKYEDQPWNQIAQTTSHVIHIKRGLLGQNTQIRVIGANSTNKISDSTTTYLESLIFETSSESIIKNPKRAWKPSLESLTKHGVGMDAIISWPIIHHENGSLLYEVSWSEAGNSFDVTGHLHTTSNAAVITLWVNTIYSVQVDCFEADKVLYSQSQPLIVNTKESHINKEVEPINTESCSGQAFAMNAFAVVSGFFLSAMIVAIIWILKKRRHFFGNNICKDGNKSGNFEAVKVESAKLIRSTPNQQEQGKSNKQTFGEKR